MQKIDSAKSLTEIKEYTAEIKKITSEHQDKGYKGFFKATWARKPASNTVFNEIFDEKNELKSNHRK